jgi:hypothetical protein
MNTTTITKPCFSGSVWYQEQYFLGALQDEIDRAKTEGSALCLVVLRLPDYSRRAARHLFAYAEAEDGRSFFGILSNGDYAICMPGGGYTEGTEERVALSHDLGEFDVCSGLAVLDQEQTAADLLTVAARACVGVGHVQFAIAKAA